MYEYRVDTLIQKNFHQGRADAYGEKNSVRMASLIGSKLAKTIRKLDRAEKTGIPWPFRAKISYDISLADSRAPGVCFVLVFRV